MAASALPSAGSGPGGRQPSARACRVPDPAWQGMGLPGRGGSFHVDSAAAGPPQSAARWRRGRPCSRRVRGVGSRGGQIAKKERSALDSYSGTKGRPMAWSTVTSYSLGYSIVDKQFFFYFQLENDP